MADHELARRSDGAIELRSAPLRLRWRFDELSCADGHRLRCDFSCSARPLSAPAEQRMLEEVFLAGSPAVTAAQVVEHFAPALRSALDRVIGGCAGAECLAEPARQQALSALRQAGSAVAFSCGLELLEPFELHLDSPTLRQQRIEQSLRQQAQQRQQDQLARAEYATKLLRQFEPVRHKLPPSAILQQFAAAEQGQVFEVLTQAGAAEAGRPPLWLVSGGMLVRCDPRSAGQAPQLHELPADAGPLRSVGSAEIEGSHRLLVGAAAGVLGVDPQSPSSAVIYRDDQIDSRRGFTRAIVWHDELWACHSDGGIVVWKLDAPQQPLRALRPQQLGGADDEVIEPKHLVAVDDRQLLFSTGGRLMVLERDGQSVDARPSPLHLEPRSEIVALLSEPHHVVSVHAGGEICRRSRATLEMTAELLRGEQIQCAAPMPWLGDARLLVGAAAGPIRCVSLEDPLVTEYSGWGGSARALAASADLVAALSPDRQRIILWESWRSSAPLREVLISAHTRHRIADLHFA